MLSSYMNESTAKDNEFSASDRYDFIRSKCVVDARVPMVWSSTLPHCICKCFSMIFALAPRGVVRRNKGIFPGSFPWITPIIVLFRFTIQCLLAAGEDVCPTGFYANGTAEEEAPVCITCTACEAGEGTAATQSARLVERDTSPGSPQVGESARNAAPVLRGGRKRLRAARRGTPFAVAAAAGIFCT